MFSSMRVKKKGKDAVPGAAGAGANKTDQKQQGKRTCALPEALKLPSPKKYYPGTQMPLDGWFHACRLCRCWTAFSATATTGEVVPLCRRCLPTAARKTTNPAPRVAKQLAGMTHSATCEGNSTGAAPRPVAADAISRQAIKGQPMAPHKSPKSSGRAADAGASQKQGYAWSSTHASIHHQRQQQHTGSQQQPMHAKTAAAFKAGSRVVRPAASSDIYNASSQPAAATLPPAMPAAAPMAAAATSATQQPYGFSGMSSNSSSLNDRRSSTGDTAYAVPCYRHLGPTNMQPPAASADHSITCLGNDRTSEGGSNQAGGSDMLGILTSLLSDLYKIGFSSSSSSGSSNGQEMEGRSSSMSKKQAAAAAVAGATDSLRNLPV